ncbi:hypothetical protein [Mycetocola spongiae]|uniref:hypothetical protein n=1 Tax=Mycetocola spongiae TaxID=2859226 RepID=UPI001CF24FB1|nr:hypothetical protein [Mycetocola spongiae]UCR90162.1 hypothetical protein KXZ72_05735 [Mycetocola spongiae]
MVRVRIAAVVLLLLAPTLLLMLLGALWLPGLPAQIPAQWNAEDIRSLVPTVPYFLLVLALALGAAIFGLVSLGPGGVETRRAVCLVSGSLAAFASAAWIASASVSRHGITEGAGGWALLMVLYGLIPLAVVPLPPRPDPYARGEAAV